MHTQLSTQTQSSPVPTAPSTATACLSAPLPPPLAHPCVIFAKTKRDWGHLNPQAPGLGAGTGILARWKSHTASKIEFCLNVTSELCPLPFGTDLPLIKKKIKQMNPCNGVLV